MPVDKLKEVLKVTNDPNYIAYLNTKSRETLLKEISVDYNKLCELLEKKKK